MALTKCKECGHVVSDTAAACPGCGARISDEPARVEGGGDKPVRVVRAGFKWEAIGAVGVIIGVILFAAGAKDVGGVMASAGFVVFMIGRFIN